MDCSTLLLPLSEIAGSAMNTNNYLRSINRLLSDVYGEEIRISSLLNDYLDTKQIAILKNEKLDEFIFLLLYGIRCRFASLADGMRLYSIMSDYYGLENTNTLSMAKIGESEGVSRERIRQLKEKALNRLKPTVKLDLLKQLACLAARETLCLHEFPQRRNNEIHPQFELTANLLEDIPLSENQITFKEIQQRINSSLGLTKANPEYIRHNQLRNWLRNAGLLEIVESNGKRTERPTERGRQIGLRNIEHDGSKGLETVTVLNRQAQEFVKQNLLTITAWVKENKAINASAVNRGHLWTLEMDQQLKLRFEEGASQSELALELGRTKQGIKARLEMHGLIPTDDDQ